MSLLFCFCLNCVEITLNNGGVISGKLLKQEKRSYFVKVKNDLYIIPNKMVIEFNPTEPNEFDTFFKKDIEVNYNNFNKIFDLSNHTEKKYPKLFLLPIGIGFGISAYDKFRNAKEIADDIKSLENENISVPEKMRRNYDHNYLCGLTYIAISVIEITISLQSVDLYVKDSTIGIQKKF